MELKDGTKTHTDHQVNVNNYYGPRIYDALGFGGSTTLMINGISGAWGVICTFVFITFIGKSGLVHVTMTDHSRPVGPKKASYHRCCHPGTLVSRIISYLHNLVVDL